MSNAVRVHNFDLKLRSHWLNINIQCKGKSSSLHTIADNSSFSQCTLVRQTSCVEQTIQKTPDCRCRPVYNFVSKLTETSKTETNLFSSFNFTKAALLIVQYPLKNNTLKKINSTYLFVSLCFAIN